MRAELARMYIMNLLDVLDTFENENDKIKTGQLVCDLVFNSDILYDQYGDHDKSFNKRFGEIVNNLYEKYPDKFKTYKDLYEEFEADMNGFDSDEFNSES